MFLSEPNSSPYDLNFRILGVHVRVHPMFWLISVLFAYDLINTGQLGLLAVWVACVFVSILIHELGHVMVGRLFGSNGHIVLHGFGGLAIGSSNGLPAWQRIAVLFAGPGAGFLLYGVVLGAAFLIGASLPPLLLIAMAFLLQINLWWGVLNLLPVWPLDGGQISAELFGLRDPRNGFRIAQQLSMVVGGAIALLTLAEYMGKPLLPFSLGGGLYMALLFGFLAYGSYELLQQVPPRDRDPWEDRSGWREPDADEWKR